MSLAAGTKLGPYEVLAPLGAGGMGEVYRARDTRLSRDVAITVIPEELAAHKDRLRRFEQEARATAALSHPNILALFAIRRSRVRAPRGPPSPTWVRVRRPVAPAHTCGILVVR
jgi:hypothetical protein